MSHRDDTAISIPPARDEQTSARNTAGGAHDGPVGRGLRQGLAHSAGLHLATRSCTSSGSGSVSRNNWPVIRRCRPGTQRERGRTALAVGSALPARYRRCPTLGPHEHCSGDI